MWRGVARVIGRDKKNVIVKHRGALRELTKIRLTRVLNVRTRKAMRENRWRRRIR